MRGKITVSLVRQLALAAATVSVLSVVGAQAQETIKFGAPLPITGALSPEAAKAQQGYDLWAEQVNKAGGIKVGDQRRKVEIIYVDYQSNTSRAVQATEGLITQNKVDFLFSPFGSGAAKAASNVSERYKVPTVAATASSSQVFDQNYKFLFGIYTPNETLLTPLTDIVRKAAPSAKRVAILARNDLFPLALAQVMAEAVKARGFEIVFNEKFAVNALDHSAALSQMKSTNPDWIFVAGYINDNLLIRKQMTDQRIAADIVTMVTGPSYPEFIDAAGVAGSENITGAAWWDPAVRYTSEDVFGSNEGYVKLFRDKYKTTPDYGHASHSAVGVILQLAIEKAGSTDREKVRDALASLDAKTFFAPIRFAPNGQANSYTPPAFQIQNGKTVVIYPAEIKQGEFRLGVK